MIIAASHRMVVSREARDRSVKRALLYLILEDLSNVYG